MGGQAHLSDIYQLGAVLYEMLTGRPPFQSTGDKLAEAIRSQTPAVPSTLNPSISPAIDRLVMQCLAKNKKDRYQSAAALKTDLLAALKSVSDPAK